MLLNKQNKNVYNFFYLQRKIYTPLPKYYLRMELKLVSEKKKILTNDDG